MVEGGKQPYAIARQDGQPMAFAGLWEGFKWTGRHGAADVHDHHHERQRDGR